MIVTPYKDTLKSKKEQVAEMFDNIAPKYDMLNHILSFGIDKLWRRKAINILKKNNPKIILDVATGTGDFAIAACRIKPSKIIGIDISKEMLLKGRKKIKKKKFSCIELQEGDSENITFENNFFDAATVAFGVRNFENLDNGLKEIVRVLKPGGIVIILEFSKPIKFPFKQFYSFYSYTLLPLMGRIISKDKTAYTYLPDSINEFPHGKDFLNILVQAGLKNVKQIPLTFGIASIYTGNKV